MKPFLRPLLLILLTCFSLSADFEPNDSCTQSELIDSLDGIISSQSATEAGDVSNTNRNDYFHFTPATAGTLTLTTLSPTDTPFRLKVGSSCDGTEHYGQLSATQHTIPAIHLSAGETLYLRVRRDSAYNEYRLDLAFAADPIPTGTDEPKTAQCGLFPGVLTAYDTLHFNGSGGSGSATTVFASSHISATSVTPLNPPGTDYITCDGGACAIELPAVIDYPVPFTASSDASAQAVTTDTEFTSLNVGNLLVGNIANPQPVVTFSASAAYTVPSTRRFMQIASLDSLNKSGITYLFNEGDYYIGSWFHRGNDLVIQTNGKVRIFIDGILQFEGNELHVNETGLPSSLLFFGNSDVIFPNSGSANYNVHAFFYTKGSFILDAHADSGSGFTGGITAEQDITLNTNQNFTYDPTGLETEGFDACGWCESNNMETGFHMVPYTQGGVDKSFELFCDASDPSDIRDLIALPIKNSANNFVFDSDAVSGNYYDQSANPRSPFSAIEINANTWQVITRGGTTGGYNIMGERFSNINLLATPFAIDWGNTVLSNCDDTRLRKAYYGQAAKIDTLDYDKATCRIDTMQFKLLDDYRHLVYAGDEVLERTCKEMAEFVPDNLGILDDTTVKGHFWIDPFNDNRSATTDIGADGRPVVAFCWYQADLQYVWTFLLGLDAKVTVSKNDLTAGQDTCSEFGLNFFVPNSKDTFNRVRKFLLDKKSEWDGYTGTIDEKINALHAGNHYYIPAERDVQIWPYGPFGVYFPENGNTPADWGDGADTPRGYMSGAPMHNVSSNANYTQSMGYKGWVSILGSQDLNKTDEWWIDDAGAGERLDCSLGGCVSTYYEPNGNYVANAWLNFLFDEQGWVYHNDDWNNNYPYYDYMCMAEDNYDTISRYSLVPGLFTAVDAGSPISDTNITTKIVSKPVELDLLLYRYDGVSGQIDTTRLQSSADKSVGVFLSRLVSNGTTEAPQLLKYLGEYSDFSSGGGRIALDLFTSRVAAKKAFISFFYCDAADANWTTCWEYNGDPDAPVVSHLGGGEKSDSYDYFALRPEAFGFTTTAGLTVRAGRPVDLSFNALDHDALPSLSYNEAQDSSFGLDINISDTAKVCDVMQISITPDVLFSDGTAQYSAYRFDEVGEYNITIAENSGAEFAAVDSGDTPDSDRLISPFSDILKVIPDHFEIRASLHDFGNGFTYLSSDLNMSARLELNITARRMDNTTTSNYTAGCYAKDFDLTAAYAPITEPLGTLLYAEQTVPVQGQAPAGTPLNLPSLPRTRYTAEHNGTAELAMLINFERNTSRPVNPFRFALQSVTVTDTDGASGLLVSDQNATFYYGRSHLPRYRIEGNHGIAKLYYEVYCNECNVSLLSAIAPSTRLSVDDINWFQNEAHTATDGEVFAISERSAFDEIMETNQTLESFSFTYSGNKGYPFKAVMQTSASSWLIYNRFDTAATQNSFMLEFNSKGDWAGNDAGTTTLAPKAFINTSRRIEW